jgi:hypothetical protein
MSSGPQLATLHIAVKERQNRAGVKRAKGIWGDREHPQQLAWETARGHKYIETNHLWLDNGKTGRPIKPDFSPQVSHPPGIYLSSKPEARAWGDLETGPSLRRA